MPTVSTGIIRLKHAADKIRRELIIGGFDLDVIREATDVLDALIKDKMLEMKLSDEDVAEIEISYNIEEGKIIWDKESLKITVYKPVEEILREMETRVKEEMGKEIEKLNLEITELKNKLNKAKSEISEIIEKLNRLIKIL